MNGQITSDHALRCVTTALLMRVWSLSREHGKFVGDDLVLEHSAVADLDQMAGAPGVGEAMKSVGWALEQRGVTLPNFKEFNVPMSPAEKQREYRDRQKRGVTAALPKRGNENSENVTTRVEKRRSKPPVVPQPGFERFWTAWPASERKESKGECAEKWNKGGFEVHSDLIVAHVESLKASDRWKQGFIVAPLVYLNKRRWEGADAAHEIQPLKVAL